MKSRPSRMETKVRARTSRVTRRFIATVHDSSPGFPPGPPLRLDMANTFFGRLKGLHGRAVLGPDEGLVLLPCTVIHTFFLRQAIDVVFLDAEGRELRLVQALPRFRVAGVRGARCVVELPAHYCQRHADYLDRIHAALAGRNTLTYAG